MHRRCWQLTQTLSKPKVVWQRWHVRRILIRIGFSTRSTFRLRGDIHSSGSSVNPYFANRARALSCCTALQRIVGLVTVEGGSAPVGDGAVGLTLIRNLQVSLMHDQQESSLPWVLSYTAALLDSPSPPKLAIEIRFEWEPLRRAEPNLFIILLKPSFSPAGRSGGGCCDIILSRR